jgi:RimJ/RimL family protein N-acetyltransferase
MNLNLKSERLLLRPHRETDLDVEIEMGTDPEVMKFVGDVETRDQLSATCRNTQDAARADALVFGV